MIMYPIKKVGLVIVLISLLGCSTIPTPGRGWTIDDIQGPCVDQVIFHVADEDERVNGLLNGTFDIICDVSQRYSAELAAHESIEVESVLENGYSSIFINCDWYPLNFSAIRKAVALTISKQDICTEIYNTTVRPLDTILPQQHVYSAEGLFESMYHSELNEANALLNDAGFLDVDNDTYRENPLGQPLEIIFAVRNDPVSIKIGECIVSSLEELGLQIILSIREILPWDPTPLIYPYREWQLALDHVSIESDDIRWIAYEFWSEYADEADYNIPKYRSAQFDSWRNQLLKGHSHEEVKEAITAMQRILFDDCPLVPLCQEYTISAYRTDRFTGFKEYDFSEILHRWNLQHIRQKRGDSLSGVLHCGVPYIPDYSQTDTELYNFNDRIFGYYDDMFFDSLLVENAEGGLNPWLCESYTKETHDDDPSVVEGNCRYTFKLLNNVTWNDGTPLTAFDIISTFVQYRNSTRFEYSLAKSISSVYSLDDFTVVVEIATESYLSFKNIIECKILSKAVLEYNNDTGWDNWYPHLGDLPDQLWEASGPFTVEEYLDNEKMTVAKNQEYFRSVDTSRLPYISGVDNITISSGTIHELQWDVQSSKPHSIEIYRNDTLYYTSEGDGSEFMLQINESEECCVMYTAYIIDNEGFCGSHTIHVTVLPHFEMAIHDFFINPISLLFTLVGSSVMIFYGARIIHYKRTKGTHTRGKSEKNNLNELPKTIELSILVLCVTNSNRILRSRILKS
ncbi:MAG: hypothetical protein GF411_19590 [Candidatus Lokiarchaeota archaeon]|nr:hypothetical protein [Candidatus Lokiarchaeota archaeon]